MLGEDRREGVGGGGGEEEEGGEEDQHLHTYFYQTRNHIHRNGGTTAGHVWMNTQLQSFIL